MRAFVFALLFGFVSQAHASIDGVFFDPAFPGEGWVFESQNDVVGGTWYTYEANGQPTFRTFVGPITYTTNPATFSTISMSGQVFRTENRTNSTQVGTFNVTFRTDRSVHTITAAGVTRNLRRFDFAFPTPLDKVKGIWVITSVAPAETRAVTLSFRPSTSNVVLDGGIGTVATRTLRTSEGFSGFIFVDPRSNFFRAFVDFGAGGYYIADLTGDDEKATGLGAAYNTSDVQIIPTEVVLGSSIANTEGEVPGVRQLFAAVGVGLPAPPLASDPGPKVTEADVRRAMAVPPLRQ